MSDIKCLESGIKCLVDGNVLSIICDKHNAELVLKLNEKQVSLIDDFVSQCKKGGE